MGRFENVVKNSLWLSIQPLKLNVISIFAIGYIARVLGQEEYGRFLFAFTFVSMFSPISNFGSRAITVRSIGESRESAAPLLGKFFSTPLEIYTSSFLYNRIFYIYVFDNIVKRNKPYRAVQIKRSIYQ